MGKESKRTEVRRNRGTWRATRNIIMAGDTCIGVTGSGLDSDLEDNNAKFIVKAVNNHDGLVEALQAVLNYYNENLPISIVTLIEKALKEVEKD